MRTALAVVLVLAGCYKTNVQLRPPGSASATSLVNDALHFSAIGVVEVSSPVDLADACSGTPDSIHEKVSVVGGIVNLFLGTFVPVLSVHNATVNCAVGPSPATSRR